MSGVIEAPIIVHIKGISDITTMSFISSSILIALVLITYFTLKEKPRGIQNLMEMALEFLKEKILIVAGEEGLRFLPLFITIFLYIFISNLLGLLPGFISPTSSISTNLALATIIFMSTHYFGIRKRGLWGYLKHFMGPPYWLAPLFFPIHIISEFVRPLSLTMRLFGNIFAKEIILGILATLLATFFLAEGLAAKLLISVPLLMRPGIILLGILVSFIQAFVFTMLSMVYIGGAVSKEH